MLEEWTVANFKSIYGRTSLPLGPLTVLAGANSSGKSALIQSILLVAQTLHNRVRSRPIVLNGHILRLGTFDDVFATGAAGGSISFGFRYKIDRHEIERDYEPHAPPFFWADEGRLTACSCEFSFSAGTSRIPGDRLQLQPRLESCRIDAFEKDRALPHVIEFRRSEIPAKEKLAVLGLAPKYLDSDDERVAAFDVISPSEYTSPYRHRNSWAEEGAIVGVGLAHFLPVGMALTFDVTEMRARGLVGYVTATEPGVDESALEFANPAVLARTRELVNEYLASSPPDTIGPTATRLIQELDANLTATNLHNLHRRLRSKMLDAHYRDHFAELVSLARGDTPTETAVRVAEPSVDTYNVLAQFFVERVKYLGPLRDEPKVVYPMEGAVDPTNVGLRGEYTAAVLDLNRELFIEYVTPELFDEKGLQAKPRMASLIAAVAHWLSYLGIVEAVEPEDRGVYGHELRVKTEVGGTLHNLLHVGVGVSQVLPVLVMSLLAPPGSTLIFEQPELHLHPRVQTRLGDFFLSLTRIGKQCIVETHSEALINRLRLRAALDMEDKTQECIKLYFVEKSGGRSSYRAAAITQYGTIADWPRGFFDQTPDEAERILRAALEKRRQRGRGA